MEARMDSGMREVLNDHLQNEIKKAFRLWAGGEISSRSLGGLLEISAGTLEDLRGNEHLNVVRRLGPLRRSKDMAIKHGKALHASPLSQDAWMSIREALQGA
jgi:hypothetical protein